MLKYSIAMGIRILCILSLVFVRGWWMIVPAVGAVFLPYFAVVIANVSTRVTAGRVEPPGALVRRDEGASERGPEQDGTGARPGEREEGGEE